MSLEEIKRAIKKLSAEEKQKLLIDLPSLLQIKPEVIAWLKVAEPSFNFWDNDEDEIYDQL